jgi:hypothetical protein
VGKKLLNILINKYLITTVIFLAWIFFFDNNNIFSNLRTLDRLNQLRKDKQFYVDEIRKDSVMVQKLLYDTLELERFAREKYQMKKSNEDVYLVIDTTGGQRQ